MNKINLGDKVRSKVSGFSGTVTKTMNKINLGDKVRSKVSGFSGTVTAICHYLHSESQYCVKSNALVDGAEKVCWFSIGELTAAPECEMGECDK